MRAKVVVEGFFHGLHRSPYHGFSVEFSEYRQYTPGDDPRYLDWRLFARSDRYYVKRFEDETNLRCHLLLDMSRSMGYGIAGLQQGRVRPDGRRDAGLFSLPATRCRGTADVRRAHARVPAGPLSSRAPASPDPGFGERRLPGPSTDLNVPIEQIAATVRKRGLIVLISDLLAPLDTLADHSGLPAIAGARSGADAGARSGGSRVHLPRCGDVSRPGIGPPALRRPADGSRRLPAAIWPTRSRHAQGLQRAGDRFPPVPHGPPTGTGPV